MQVKSDNRHPISVLNFKKNLCEILPAKQWLLENSLKAQGLSFYQILSPNAFSYAHSYIRSIDKEVKSVVHHQSMIQVEWFDGRIKNVHVDPAVLSNYLHQLSNTISIYKKQFSLMTKSSWQLFGNIFESNITVIIDLSEEASYCLHFLLTSLKLLFEEQLLHKSSFKVICCNPKLDCFESYFVDENSINQCWNWLLSLSCGGMRKIFPALKCAFKSMTIDNSSLYLISLGQFYDNMDPLVSYIEEAMLISSFSINCVYLQPPDSIIVHDRFDDPLCISKKLKAINEAGNGKFHWSFKSDVVENEDLRLLASEMNKAGLYINKTEILLEKFHLKCRQKKERKITEK
ncbi:von Willebrand factor A domain-containing protein 3A isoform X1 [Hydra vulgaris]|uniref:von Willebrand factor A domain-containing protein 3A isoform X1 n=1 Tax=Hydra vulgaris TaxID=6087 RepID=UPI001F5EA84E|nr:von Willebrand factor A domain-containing protein 3A [Hydra vulgaris]